MAEYIELTLEQGADFNNTINLIDDTTQQYVNVAGYTVQSQIKLSPYSSNITANLVCSVYDAANGGISFGLDAANTSNINGGRYSFDLITIDLSNKKTRVLEGLIFVDAGVTK